MDKLKRIKEKMRQGSKVNILCFGNSITHGFSVNGFGQVSHPYPQHLEGLLKKLYDNDSIRVINEGHNGWRCTEALPYLPEILKKDSLDLIIMMFGINDAYSGYRPDYYQGKMEQMVQLIQAQDIQIILMNPSPITTYLNAKVREYTPILQKLAEEYQLTFFNLYEGLLAKAETEEMDLELLLPDQVHLRDEQYVWIADLIFEALFRESQD
ncbi:MAG: SGNH/GDSL hydrolase family protein [Bacteroidota bacterium]